MKQPPKWLDVPEQRSLIRLAAKHGNKREAAIVAALVHTGLHVNEFVALVKDDLTVKERSGSVLVRHGKGRKQRSVPLNAKARAAFSTLLSMSPATSPGVAVGQRGADGTAGSVHPAEAGASREGSPI